MYYNLPLKALKLFKFWAFSNFLADLKNLPFDKK